MTLQLAASSTAAAKMAEQPLAVLFDRDDTLIADVPYNGDPDAVEPVPGARAEIQHLREAGLKVGVVTNQSGVARGYITTAQMRAVNQRVEDLLGPFDTWQVCPHEPADSCSCRKPLPGLVLAAAVELGVPPQRCVVIGDIGSDMEAAAAAGAHGILVPTSVTLLHEIEAAPEVAGTLGEAVRRVLAQVRQ